MKTLTNGTATDHDGINGLQSAINEALGHKIEPDPFASYDPIFPLNKRGASPINRLFEFLSSIRIYKEDRTEYIHEYNRVSSHKEKARVVMNVTGIICLISLFAILISLLIGYFIYDNTECIKYESGWLWDNCVKYAPPNPVVMINTYRIMGIFVFICIVSALKWVSVCRKIEPYIFPKKPSLILHCPFCKHHLPEDRWYCSYCNNYNYKSDEYTFFYNCKKCNKLPHTIICPSCIEAIPLLENPACELDLEMPAFYNKEDRDKWRKKLKHHSNKAADVIRLERELQREREESKKEQEILQQEIEALRHKIDHDPYELEAIDLKRKLNALNIKAVLMAKNTVDIQRNIDTVLEKEKVRIEKKYEPDSEEYNTAIANAEDAIAQLKSQYLDIEDKLEG